MPNMKNAKKAVPNNHFIEDEKILSDNKFPTLDNVASLMQEKIEAVAKDNDSIGGIIQTAIVNLPVGLGEPMFSSLESKLSSALFSIGAVKGVEFGRGFDYVNYLGSQVNDEFTIKDNKVVFSEIEEVVSADTRNIFLQWIAQANMNSQKIGRTEYGHEYRLIRKK